MKPVLCMGCFETHMEGKARKRHVVLASLPCLTEIWPTVFFYFAVIIIFLSVSGFAEFMLNKYSMTAVILWHRGQNKNVAMIIWFLHILQFIFSPPDASM